MIFNDAFNIGKDRNGGGGGAPHYPPMNNTPNYAAHQNMVNRLSISLLLTNIHLILSQVHIIPMGD